MELKQTIRNARDKFAALMDYIAQKFKDEGYEVQVMNFGENGIIQVRNTSDSTMGWIKTLTGLENIATLKVDTEGDDLIIEAAAGKWLDKFDGYEGAKAVLKALHFKSVFGMMNENKLINRLFNESLQFLSK